MLTKKSKDPKSWNTGVTTGKYLKKESPASDVPSESSSFSIDFTFRHY